jgi:hypothetical protein
MSDDIKDAIFLITGGPALKLIKKHIADRQALTKRIIAMQKDLGEDNLNGVTTDRTNGRVFGFSFKKIPAGWTQSNSNGTSRPKLGTEWAKRLAAEKGYPHAEQVIAKGLGIPLQLHVKDKDGEGWRHIGRMLSACGWLYLSSRGPYAMWVPDVPAYVKKAKAAGHRVLAPASTFKLEFEGCKRILDEEWELMVAQHNLKKAKRK